MGSSFCFNPKWDPAAVEGQQDTYAQHHDEDILDSQKASKHSDK
jgi:hypothetical protein